MLYERFCGNEKTQPKCSMDLDSKKRRESRDGEVKEERGRRGKQGK